MQMDREAFEAWARSVTWGYDSEGYPIGLNTETLAQHGARLGLDWRQLKRTGDGDDYCSDDTQIAWLAWQAARQLPDSARQIDKIADGDAPALT